ncbi:EAL domain-containing protein [Bradyrhizobium sp. cf659]|uniref:EAL domain-containing protein n=1 Tax=Bradyrhizobium sp. cf659 TaxID=1761771 RepID=UPI000B89BF31|nr:EAL domain-containing protein [Bradyrhizobium sp. cf659]
MTVVAEAVEAEAQRRTLAELGCDTVQGFLHAPALPGRIRALADRALRRAGEGGAGGPDLAPTSGGAVRRSG